MPRDFTWLWISASDVADPTMLIVLGSVIADICAYQYISDFGASKSRIEQLTSGKSLMISLP